MKCMCAQTRPRLILSSERVLGGMEFEPMLTPREKSPLEIRYDSFICKNSPEIWLCLGFFFYSNIFMMLLFVEHA